MNKKTIEEQIFDFLEPCLRKGSMTNASKYKTSSGEKSKLGVLIMIRTLIDQNTR
jgi:hypothetical protein